MMDIFDAKDIMPMLIAENMPPFDDPDWIYELKFDGIRCLAYLDKDKTILRNKRNKDVTAIYPELSGIHKQAKKRCILDGEVFIYANGKNDFFEMQRRSLMSNPFKIQLAAAKMPVSFVAFDILYYDGENLTPMPLLKRKQYLQRAVKECDRLAVSRSVEGAGISLFQAADAQGLEGIIAKRKDSRYHFGKRTKDWIKCKALIDEDFVVCGYYLKADNLVSVIIGLYDQNKIVYQGHVVMGVSRHDYKNMASSEPASKSLYPDFPEFEDARWLKPVLVCTVHYMERTRNDGLRQPIFKGLRDDKLPKECKVDE